MTRRADLIDELSRELTPTRRLRQPAVITLVWLAGSWLFAVAAAHAIQGMRAGFAEQLASQPRFAAETFFGLTAGVFAATLAIRLGVPGSGSARRRVVLSLAMLGVWASAYVYGLFNPALEPSRLGARPACNLEVLVYGALITLAGLGLLRRLASLERVYAGIVVGAAAGAIPALLMEVACMYVPSHILTHHIAPVAAVMAIGAALAPVLLRRI